MRLQSCTLLLLLLLLKLRLLWGLLLLPMRLLEIVPLLQLPLLLLVQVSLLAPGMLADCLRYPRLLPLRLLLSLQLPLS